MVGQLFAINAINVARAAQREAASQLRSDPPVEITVDSRTNGYQQLFITVRSPNGPATEIDVDDAEVRACLETDQPGDGRRMVTQLIDRLAGEILAAVPVAELIRGTRRPIDSGPRVFENVADRDLITIMERLCGSLEYYSMLAAMPVMREVGERGLWPAVIERRAYLMRLRDTDLSEAGALESAQWHVDHFRDQHFPVPPEDPAEEGAAADGWNGYIQF